MGELALLRREPLHLTLSALSRLILSLLTFSLVLLSALSVRGQEISYPYNPDANADSAITAPDLLDFLPVFAQPFVPQEITVDDIPLSEYLHNLNVLFQEGISLVNTTMGADTRSLRFPDGLNEMIVIHHDFVEDGPLTVPEGKNLYINHLLSAGGTGVSFMLNGSQLFVGGNLNTDVTFKTPMIVGAGKELSVEYNTSYDYGTVAGMQGILVNRLAQDTIIPLHLNTNSGSETTFTVPEGKTLLIQFHSQSQDGGAYHIPFIAVDGAPIANLGIQGNITAASSPQHSIIAAANSVVSLYPSHSQPVNYGTNTLYGVLVDEDHFDTPIASIEPLNDTGPCQDSTSLTYQGVTYGLVEVGEQCWFAQNLEALTFADGTPISNYCEDIEAEDIEGTHMNQGCAPVYSILASRNARNICPSGWKVPSMEDFTILAEHFGGLEVAGPALRSTTWNGTNISGFSADENGLSGAQDCNVECGQWVHYWTTEQTNNSLVFALNPWDMGVSFNAYSLNFEYHAAIRCLKD